MTRVGFQIVVYESRHAAVPTAAVDLNDLIAAPFARLHSVGTSAQHGQTFVQTLTFEGHQVAISAVIARPVQIASALWNKLYWCFVTKKLSEGHVCR